MLRRMIVTKKVPIVINGKDFIAVADEEIEKVMTLNSSVSDKCNEGDILIYIPTYAFDWSVFAELL